MGCDIHVVVQRLDGGKWEDVPLGFSDDYGPDDNEDLRNAWEGRQYWGFGILAGLRRPDAPMIAAPRGLPDDFEVIDGEHDGKDMGDHSFSWFTLAELMATTPEQRDSLVGEWIPMLREFGKPDEVRVVFGFDS